MTTDPSLPEQKKRRFIALDSVVFALAIVALASPFVARFQSQASAASPQVAILGDVSVVRPIDIAMGYDEERAEAAFFEGLEEPTGTETDAALDMALAGATSVSIPEIDEPLPQASIIDATEALPISEDDPEVDFAKDLSPTRPEVEPEIEESAEVDELDAATAEAEVAEFEIEDSETDLAELDEPDPVITVRVIMSAPPTMTPVPNASPRRAQTAEVEVASIDAQPLDNPAEEMPPTENIDTAIEESPLPPLAVETEAVSADTSPAPTPLEIEELPADVTPDEDAPAPVVIAQKVPQPARPPAKVTNGPRIALVITAAGLNANVTRFAIEALPEGVTLAFAPIRPEAGELAREAKDDGHTILVEIPMEPINQSRDPGPMTLRVADGPAKNLSRLDQALARISVADGASSYLGARFNADERAAGPVIQALSERGLFFFENDPTSRSVFQRLAKRTNLPYARGIVKIDRDRGVTAIRRALDDLEKQARRSGYAVGVGTALRGTISTVALWSKEAEKRGVRLVPITEVGR